MQQRVEKSVPAKWDVVSPAIQDASMFDPKRPSFLRERLELVIDPGAQQDSKRRFAFLSNKAGRP